MCYIHKYLYTVCYIHISIQCVIYIYMHTRCVIYIYIYIQCVIYIYIYTQCYIYICTVCYRHIYAYTVCYIHIYLYTVCYIHIYAYICTQEQNASIKKPPLYWIDQFKRKKTCLYPLEHNQLDTLPFTIVYTNIVLVLKSRSACTITNLQYRPI